MDFDVSKIGIDPNALENAALGDFDDYVKKPTAPAPIPANNSAPTVDYSPNTGVQMNTPDRYDSLTGEPLYGNNATAQGNNTNMGAQTGYDPYAASQIYVPGQGAQAGYDPYAAPQGYDPNMGAPMGYDPYAVPQGYDPNMGAPMGYDPYAVPQGYDPNMGAPMGYDPYAVPQGYDPNMGSVGYNPYAAGPYVQQQPDNGKKKRKKR